MVEKRVENGQETERVVFGIKDKSITLLIMGLLDKFLNRGPSIQDIVASMPKLPILDQVINRADEKLKQIAVLRQNNRKQMESINWNLENMNDRAGDTPKMQEKSFKTTSYLGTPKGRTVIPYYGEASDDDIITKARRAIPKELDTIYQWYTKTEEILKSFIKKCETTRDQGNQRESDDVVGSTTQRIQQTQVPLALDTELTTISSGIDREFESLLKVINELVRVSAASNSMQSDNYFGSYGGYKWSQEQGQRNADIIGSFLKRIGSSSNGEEKEMKKPLEIVV